MENKSLATGADLDKETFDDFVSRLRHDCEGEGVKDHCTACAIFTVQSRRLIAGIDLDYASERAAFIEDRKYFSPDEFYDDCDELQAQLDAYALDSYGSAEKFSDLGESEKWDAISECEEVTVTGIDWRWEHVNSHFTKDAAEAFIRRKKHDYRDGLRVYVDAQVYCWEFEAIKSALMSGRLVLAEPTP